MWNRVDARLRRHLENTNSCGLSNRIFGSDEDETYIRVLDRKLTHAGKNDKVRHHRPGRDETRRRHPFNAVYDTGEELFLGTDFVHKHRFIQTAYNSNRTFTIKKM
uniref:Uncharacterized protein n=1 Tax=Angiostrongylus cantonensis TaxID=6313 RepID=A0A0K0CZR8_ANGCA